MKAFSLKEDCKVNISDECSIELSCFETYLTKDEECLVDSCRAKVDAGIYSLVVNLRKEFEMPVSEDEVEDWYSGKIEKMSKVLSSVKETSLFRDPYKPDNKTRVHRGY